jgi:hypothetical protein
MRAIRYVTAHRGGEESFRCSPLYASLGEREPLCARLNNRQGLSQVYNLFLDGRYEEFATLGPPARHSPEDIVVFVHDDVEVIGNNVAQELNRWADEGFAILGLAGASKFVIEPPTLWHLMAERGARNGMSVFHIAWNDPVTGELKWDGDQPRPTLFGPYGEVVILDGLFLGVVRDAVDRVGWRFDERFRFHHYDLASCLNAHALGLRMRTVFVPVIHRSVGLLNMEDPEFLKSQDVFLRTYASNGPVRVAI